MGLPRTGIEHWDMESTWEWIIGIDRIEYEHVKDNIAGARHCIQGTKNEA